MAIIFDIYKSELKWALLGICLVMSLLPYSVLYGSSSYFLIAITAYILWMALSNKKGFSFVLISLCLCYPASFMKGVETGGQFEVLEKGLFIIPVLILIVLMFLKRFNMNFKIPIIYSFVYLLLTLMHGDNILEALFKITGTHIAFCIGCYEGLSRKQMFSLFSIAFAFVAIYAGCEYYLNLCPYEPIYMSSYGFELWEKRAMGLMGNPLLLCSVTMIYQAAIFIDAIEQGKLNYIAECMCLFVALIVTSRTSVYVLAILFLLYVFLKKSNFSPSTVFKFVVVSIILYFVVITYFDNVISLLVERFSTGDQTHRQSSYWTALNVMAEHPFGLGHKDFGVKILPYVANGFEYGLVTLDNFISTQFACYGLFGVVMILFYLTYNIRLHNESRPQGIVRYSNILYAAVFLLMGLSFDIEAYFHVTMIYFILVGYIYGNNSTENYIYD